MSDNKDNDSAKPEDETSAADDWADALNEQSAAEQSDTTDGSAEDAWGDAMAEQEAAETGGESAEDAWGDALAEQAAEEPGDAAGDAWGDALAEQDTTEEPRQSGSSTPGSDDIFKPLEGESGAGASRDLDMIMEIPVTLSVELGQTRLTIRELLDLSQGSIIELDGLAGEPMDIQINGYLIAQGEVVVVDDRYGIRITDIITPSERIHKLNNR